MLRASPESDVPGHETERKKSSEKNNLQTRLDSHRHTSAPLRFPLLQIHYVMCADRASSLGFVSFTLRNKYHAAWTWCCCNVYIPYWLLPDKTRVCAADLNRGASPRSLLPIHVGLHGGTSLSPAAQICRLWPALSVNT